MSTLVLVQLMVQAAHKQTFASCGGMELFELLALDQALATADEWHTFHPKDTVELYAEIDGNMEAIWVNGDATDQMPIIGSEFELAKAVADGKTDEAAEAFLWGTLPAGGGLAKQESWRRDFGARVVAEIRVNGAKFDACLIVAGRQEDGYSGFGSLAEAQDWAASGAAEMVAAAAEAGTQLPLADAGEPKPS